VVHLYIANPENPVTGKVSSFERRETGGGCKEIVAAAVQGWGGKKKRRFRGRLDRADLRHTPMDRSMNWTSSIIMRN